MRQRAPFTPKNWFWHVAGDTSKAYSSLAGAYVSVWPAECVTNIASEDELSDVLRSHGLEPVRPSAVDIKAEAQRRIIALMGTASLETCIIKQLNAQMRANDLNDKRLQGATLTAGETAEADALRAMATAIKHIRTRSNELEMTLPADYRSNTHWMVNV